MAAIKSVLTDYSKIENTFLGDVRLRREIN
jgi:hypothetical protein